MAQQPKHWITESDIGSGEPSPGQEDVERDTLALGEDRYRGGLPQASDDDAANGKTLRDGNHLARILATPQPDGRYEAQVYVRLTREPETAETYIPAGTFTTEQEAWRAAEERARRAFTENEF